MQRSIPKENFVVRLAETQRAQLENLSKSTGYSSAALARAAIGAFLSAKLDHKQLVKAVVEASK